MLFRVSVFFVDGMGMPPIRLLGWCCFDVFGELFGGHFVVLVLAIAASFVVCVSGFSFVDGIEMSVGLVLF